MLDLETTKKVIKGIRIIIISSGFAVTKQVDI